MQQFSLFDQCVMLPYNNQVRERCLSFTCGDTDLDDFFHNDAERYAAELWVKLIVGLPNRNLTDSSTFYSCQ